MNNEANMKNTFGSNNPKNKNNAPQTPKKSGIVLNIDDETWIFEWIECLSY